MRGAVTFLTSAQRTGLERAKRRARVAALSLRHSLCSFMRSEDLLTASASCDVCSREVFAKADGEIGGLALDFACGERPPPEPKPEISTRFCNVEPDYKK